MAVVNLVTVNDKDGFILYQREPMMRDYLGISQRQILRNQATRETMPRDVTPKAMALPERRGWLAKLLGWLA